MPPRLEMVQFDPHLESHGWRKYSQNDEDGVLHYIFSILPPGPNGRFFVEFGIGPRWGAKLEDSGLEGNCRLLRENGWAGIFFDSNAYPHHYGVKQERMDALNVNAVLRKHWVPECPDIISIDVDGQDYWIWSNLIFRPRVIVIEYNASLPANESKVIPFDASYRWDGTKWFGASLRALFNLGKSKDYTLVYANGVNGVFVKNSLVKNKADFAFENVYGFRDVHPPDTKRRPWVQIPEIPTELD